MIYYNRDGLGYKSQCIMQCFWDIETPLTVPQIITLLEKKYGQKYAPSTINTLLLSLLKKGFLMQGEKSGHAFTYQALITEQEFQMSELQRFKKLNFNNSTSGMIVALLNESDINEKDLQEIQRILEQYD